MRIAVPIKQVPETSSVRMDEQTGTMIREGVEAIVNPLDLFAIETAVRLREAGLDAEIVALSMGPPKARVALAEAVAMGCDRAVLLSHRDFAGADTWSTSYVLARAIAKLAPVDLVLCGERATDGDTGQVGPGIAAWLDWPVVTYVSGIEAPANGVVTVRRLREEGYERLEADLPAVVTVVKEVASPRLPTLTGKRRARQMDLPVWGPADIDAEPGHLGLDGSPTRVVKIHRPTVARACELLPADTEPQLRESVDRLVAWLGERGLTADAFNAIGEETP